MTDRRPMMTDDSVAPLARATQDDLEAVLARITGGLDYPMPVVTARAGEDLGGLLGGIRLPMQY